MFIIPPYVVHSVRQIVLSKRDRAVSFRSSVEDLMEASIVKANAMLQTATNKALKIEVLRFNKKI